MRCLGKSPAAPRRAAWHRCLPCLLTSTSEQFHNTALIARHPSTTTSRTHFPARTLMFNSACHALCLYHHPLATLSLPLKRLTAP